MELTSRQRKQLDAIRRRIETEEKGEILALARRLRSAKRQGTAALKDSLKLLRAERRAQGLSLAVLEQRTGIAKSNLSKLENARQANPTITTLATYADALGKKLVISLVDK